ncbi:MAG: DUF1566 domain-containing protein [Alphaproteobacteria bacterium]
MRTLQALAAAAILLLATTEARAGARPTKARPLKTGETTSYGLGSDGNLQKGLSRLFTDLGNGIVRDVRTGLSWERKSDDGSIHDRDNTYTWGQTVSPYAMTGTAVQTFLATLNRSPCFGGYCDWRIPNRRELETLISLDADDPATVDEFDDGCTPGCSVTVCNCTRSSTYWTSSSVWNFPDAAWVVDFNGGLAGYDFKTKSHHVRAVRGG